MERSGPRDCRWVFSSIQWPFVQCMSAHHAFFPTRTRFAEGFVEGFAEGFVGVPVSGSPPTAPTHSAFVRTSAPPETPHDLCHQ